MSQFHICIRARHGPFMCARNYSVLAALIDVIKIARVVQEFRRIKQICRSVCAIY